MLTWRITYLAGGQRRITFFGISPNGRRLTLVVKRPPVRGEILIDHGSAIDNYFARMSASNLPAICT
jgi:hypothetical protein